MSKREEILKEDIFLQMSNLDLLTVCGNMHLSLIHPMNNGAAFDIGKALLKKFLLILFCEGITLPANVLEEYEKVTGPLDVPPDLITEPEWDLEDPEPGKESL